MKLIDKYLLREYLTHLTYCLLAFCMIFVIYDISGEISKMIQHKTPVAIIALYYLATLGPSMEYILPASLLFATLYTLWQLTKSNELTAMRASGISLLRIMMPFLSVGIIASGFIWALKDTINPRANMWTDDLREAGYDLTAQKIATDQSYMNSKDNRRWRIDKIDINHPSQLIGVRVLEQRKDGTREREIFASKAEWLDGEWWFHDVQIRRYDTDDNPVRKDDLPEQETHGSRVMLQLTEKPTDFLTQLKKKWEYLTSREVRAYLAANQNLSGKTIAEIRFDLFSRTAMPFACLIVTFFAVPVGARTGRQDMISGIFMAMAFFIGYYAIANVGMFTAKSERIWPLLGAWLSNIVFLTTGVIMAVRMR